MGHAAISGMHATFQAGMKHLCVWLQPLGLSCVVTLGALWLATDSSLDGCRCVDLPSTSAASPSNVKIALIVPGKPKQPGAYLKPLVEELNAFATEGEGWGY